MTTDLSQFDTRTVRAITQYLTVTPDIGRAADNPSETLVTSESGQTYLVNVVLGTCECEDHEHRDVECKHIRRARMAMGMSPIPVDLVEELADEVDSDLGLHTDKDPRFVTPDGTEFAGGQMLSS